MTKLPKGAEVFLLESERPGRGPDPCWFTHVEAVYSNREAAEKDMAHRSTHDENGMPVGWSITPILLINDYVYVTGETKGRK